MSKTKNAEIAHCLPLSGLLHTFADYLRNFSFFFACGLFAVWSIWGGSTYYRETTMSRLSHA